MITRADLKAQTRRELADLAKNYGVAGWHGMKKDELVEAIRKVHRRLRQRADSGETSARSDPQAEAESASASVNGKTTPNGKVNGKRAAVGRRSPKAAVKTASPQARSTKSKAPKVGDSSPKASRSVPKASRSVPKASRSAPKANRSAPKANRSAPKANRSAPKAGGPSSEPSGASSNAASTRKAKGSRGSAKAAPSSGRAASSVSRGGSSPSRAGASAGRRGRGGVRAGRSDGNDNRHQDAGGNDAAAVKSARARAQIRKRQLSAHRHKDLSTGTLVGGSAVKQGAKRIRADEPHRDRAVLLVRDAYWLQATWEITSASVRRAQSALAERWHTAAPTLRVLNIGDVSNNGAEVVERDIPIHGGVNNWYIDVDDPPSRFRVQVGYLDANGEFYSLCRSNIVETPRPGDCERLDEHWRDIAEDYERIYSLSGGYDVAGGDLRDMFEERLHRAMPLRGEQGRTMADPALLRESHLPFDVDAELIVFGKTASNASVTVGGRPVKLQADGSFTVRMDLPDRRQVIPVTAESRDGLRQRTTVVAVERNTKVMEPIENDEPF